MEDKTKTDEVFFIVLNKSWLTLNVFSLFSPSESFLVILFISTLFSLTDLSILFFIILV